MIISITFPVPQQSLFLFLQKLFTIFVKKYDNEMGHTGEENKNLKIRRTKMNGPGKMLQRGTPI